MSVNFRTPLIITVGFLLSPPAAADVRLPAIFSDHAVLQRDSAVTVWGWADSGEAVTVTIGGQTKTASPGDGGKWTVKLDKLAAGGPHTLTVKGKNTLVVNDVLVGEVWLASGQSNMGFKMNRVKDAAAEMAAAKCPQIRMFTVAHHPSREPQADCKGAWVVCSPETVGQFSAVAFLFGRELHQTLGVPVGMINSSVGGTNICAWTSMDAQKAVAALKPMLTEWDEAAAKWDPKTVLADYEKERAAWKEKADKAKAAGKAQPPAPKKPVDPRDINNHPAVLFNGMIAPIIPYTIRGAIWYQGENNAQSPEGGRLYRVQLPLMIHDWRARWNEGDFPFAWVQLPNIKRPADSWMLARESMLESLAMPNTGMAVAIDVGEANDIHPKDKQPVGHRLALWALGTVYGKPVATSGPLPTGFEIKGNNVVVRFSHTDGGLVPKGGELRGFEVKGADGAWAKAIVTVSGDTVIATSSDIKQPIAVRYAWADNPDCNLYNGAGLPASPFRLGEK
jgi:hypothetical protein